MIARIGFFLILTIAPALALQALPVAAANTTAMAWAPTGNMNVARFGHTAARLADGRVLVVGGSNNSGGVSTFLASTELYDPVSGTWSVAGNLASPRTEHTETTLSDGTVLVVGGRGTSGISASAELYDPRNRSWLSVQSLSAGRTGHTATLLLDGKVLIAGGGGEKGTEFAELYDSETRTWSRAGMPSIQRVEGTATRLTSGKILFAGGWNLVTGNIREAALAEIYDPVAGSWSLTGRMVTARDQHAAVLLRDGRVLVVGGADDDNFLKECELYDPSFGTWGATGRLNLEIFSPVVATLLKDGNVLMEGDDISRRGAEFYDPLSGQWRIVGERSADRYAPSATLLLDGRVLVAGGLGILTLASAELYGDAVAIPGAIGPTFTGSWYDPAQSGHGLFIQVLSDDRIFAGWFAFEPAGTQQAWFTGVGTYSGNTATISSVEQPSGGRWIPNFDAGKVVHNTWGTLTFTFADCDHGKVDFNSVAGYGTGTMNLTRLTQPAGLTCP